MTDRYDELLTAQQVARQLGKGESTIYWLVRHKGLPTATETPMRFTLRQIAAWHDQQRGAPSDHPGYTPPTTDKGA